MKEIFTAHPEVTEIKAEIIKRKYSEDFSEIVLDKTIFIPKTFFLEKDTGFIDDYKLKDVRETSKGIIHYIKERPAKSSVVLKTDFEKRQRDILYNSAFYLISLLRKKFFNRNVKDGRIVKDYAEIELDVSGVLFEYYDLKKFEDFLNYVLEKNPECERKNGILKIFTIGEIDFDGPLYKEIRDIFAVKILKFKKDDESLKISFSAGEDYKKLVAKKFEDEENIKKIIGEEIKAEEKIAKIVNEIS